MKTITAGEDAAALVPSFLPYAEEGFLLTLTNRGIYNRSLKDYDVLEGPVVLAAVDGRLSVTFPDAAGKVTVLLDQKIAGSRCSCPSGTTCKHVLMALLAVKELGGRSAPVEQEKTADQEPREETAALPGEPDYAELEQINLEDLKKEAGKKNYEEALRLTADGYGAEFPPGVFDGSSKMPGMLAASVEAYGVTVYFPRRNSIAASVCKCGEQGLCLHKTIALLSWMKARGRLDGENEIPAWDLPGESALALLESARNFAGMLLEKGLISADETAIEGAQQFSLKFEGEGIGNLSRLFRGLATDMENMLAKNAAFNPNPAFSGLSRIYNTASLIPANRNDKNKCSALIEKSRAAYRTIPMGTFTGLGAHPWITRSGFTGVSALVFHQERKAFLSYSVSMADFYEATANAASRGSLKSLYERGEHWDAGVSLKEISRNTFSLRNFKASDEGRLSSSKETRYTGWGKTKAAGCESLSADFRPHAVDEQRYDYFAKQGRRTYCVVLSGAIVDCVYDKVRQELRFVFSTEKEKTEDDDGEPALSLPALIPYSDINLAAIRFMEALAGKDAFPAGWFICERSRRGLIPLSLVGDQGVENFYFN
jgi:hypothetical protein